MRAVRKLGPFDNYRNGRDKQLWYTSFIIDSELKSITYYLESRKSLSLLLTRQSGEWGGGGAHNLDDYKRRLEGAVDLTIEFTHEN